jgi:hypothetical protein
MASRQFPRYIRGWISKAIGASNLTERTFYYIGDIFKNSWPAPKAASIGKLLDMLG